MEDNANISARKVTFVLVTQPFQLLGSHSERWTCMVSSIQIWEGEPAPERVAVARKPDSEVSTWYV